jgi:tetratricopeptide (TPR) repeat protein
VKVVKQYWYPIRQLGEIKNANLDAAVNLDVDPSGKVRFALNTTTEFRDAKVVLQAGAKTLFTRVISISPEKPFAEQVALPPGVRSEDLRAVLFSAAGKELISYQPVKPKGAAMPKPVEPPPPPKDVKSNEELYLAGQRLEQFHSPALEPYPYYEEAVRRDPGDSRANTALGILYLKRGMFREAEEKFQAAIARLTRNYTSPKDGEAFYYLGVALKAQGRYGAADDAFHKAAWSQAWYAASHHALAENACRRGQFAEALEMIDRAVATNALSTKALDLRATLLRKLGRSREAVEVASRVQAIDPLDFWARNESYLNQASNRPDDDEASLAELHALMRGDVQSYLELAVDYGNCGLWREAIEVLDRYVEATEDKQPVYPMVHYYLGYYLEQRRSERADKDYWLGAEMPTEYCFPFRLESITVLERAMERNPKDARAPYYLGNLLYDLQPEKAVAAWEQSRSLDDRFATVHRNLGLAYARVEKDNAKAVVSLEKAVACDPGDPKLYAELDTVYEAAGADHAKRLAMLQSHQQTVAQRDDALLREIILLVLVGQYDRAIDLLENHHFHLWEGESGIHDVYVDAHLLRGQQHFQAKRYADALKDYLACLEYPERFETGRPYRRGGRLSQIDYFLGMAYEALDNAEQAKMRYQQAAAGKPDWSEARYYQALAYQKLGEPAKAAEIFDGLIRTGTERLEARSDVEFFAKFGARQSVTVQKAQAHYLVGLGYLGKRQSADAKRHFNEAVKLNVNHLGARTMLAGVQ